jgi:hypothetical protein
MIVRDYKQNEMKVGTKVIYGSSENVAEVISISDPDIYSHDDEYGVEHVDGYMVEIEIRFDDGSTDKLKAGIVIPPGPWDQIEIVDEIFEENGDLEVIV